jgi:peptide-methionine (S)-S-oxide reductase
MFKFCNLTLLWIFLLVSNVACSQKNKKQIKSKEGMETAVLAGGCFWCVEAVFQQLNGVDHVESGYTGGSVVNPTYEQVCEGNTGHAEVIKIWYDPAVVSFTELLEVFFKTHDPTTLNRQGADVGTQYRSAIFYRNEDEKKISEEIIAELNESGYYADKIVTTLEPLKEYYAAEDYHQNYFNRKGDQNPYCQMVVKPKLEKFEKIFKDKIKKQ